MRDFIFLGSKITADGDCSHEIKRFLLLERKVMTNLDSILKSRDIPLVTKVHLVKAMVFPVVMYGCESWTIKKSERQKIDASIHQCTVLVFFFLAYFRESGKIWENGIETCKISCMKRVASPGSMHDTGCLGLVHWDDPEGWYVWGGRREKGSGWGTHVYLGRIHFDIWQN